MTAGGKNVAPALLEDRLRAHPLISQAMVVGDAQPFIAALITIDPEAFPGWKQRNGKDASATVGDLAEDPDLLAEVELAVKDANQAVSHAESIRKFRILPVDFTEDTGELTPTMKVKRKVVAEKFAERHRRALREVRATNRSAAATRRSRLGAPLPVRRRPTRRPAAPIAAARSGSASRSPTAAAIAPTSQPSTTSPVSPSTHRLRCAAGAAGDHRHARRRRLQVDDAEALDVEPGSAGAARHREHVGHRVVGGQLLGGHPVGEHHVLGDAETRGPAAAGSSR